MNDYLSCKGSNNKTLWVGDYVNSEFGIQRLKSVRRDLASGSYFVLLANGEEVAAALLTLAMRGVN